MTTLDKKKIILAVGVLVLVALFSVIGVKLALKTRAEDKVEDGVARLEITLTSTNLEELNGDETKKETKFGGNYAKIIEDGKETKYDEVEIKRRGNSTFSQICKPYQIKFAEKVNFLGLGEAKKWILLANYFDETNLRTDIAMRIAEMLEQEYATRGKFVWLTIDGEEQGLYYAIRKVEIDKNSVDLRKPTGVLVEIDNLNHPDEICYYSALGNCLVLKDVVSKLRETEAMHDFLLQFNQLEREVEEGDFEAIAEILDIESTAKYYLLSEFTANPDAYVSSFYFYKDGPEDKIHLGPGWDFDFALANENWVWRASEAILSPVEDEVIFEGTEGRAFIQKLVKMPEFREVVQDIFRETLSGKMGELLEYYDETEEKIYEMARKNEEKYQEVLEEGRKDFMVESEKLRAWIEKRFEHFEELYGEKHEDVL